MKNLLRNTSVFYLMLLMLLKVLAIPAICLHYQLNKAYIAANLCENKARPSMKCNGKCHLRKQLAKASESADSTGQVSGNSMPVLDYCEMHDLPDFKLSILSITIYPLLQDAGSAAGHTGNIFHPPIA
jgi:hypothetical protein